MTPRQFGTAVSNHFRKQAASPGTFGRLSGALGGAATPNPAAVPGHGLTGALSGLAGPANAAVPGRGLMQALHPQVNVAQEQLPDQQPVTRPSLDRNAMQSTMGNNLLLPKPPATDNGPGTGAYHTPRQPWQRGPELDAVLQQMRAARGPGSGAILGGVGGQMSPQQRGNFFQGLVNGSGAMFGPGSRGTP